MEPAPARIGVAGDWHGNTAWATRAVRKMAGLLPADGPRVIVHLGDFGIWPGAAGREYLARLDAALAEAGAELSFIDGNHEDFTQLARLRPGEDGRAQVTERIYHLPRGHRWRWHGRDWLALGGAGRPISNVLRGLVSPKGAQPVIPSGRVDGPRLFRGAQQVRRDRVRHRAAGRPGCRHRYRHGSRHRRGRRGQAGRGRGDVRMPGQARRPPLGTRLGVLAVPADVRAGLAAVGHHQTSRQRDTAQRALRGRQGAMPVVTLRGHR
jgi:hypothetical protein